MSDGIDTERAEAIAMAACLFYRRFDEEGPITPIDFSDALHNMTRRLWGLAAAVEGILGHRKDTEAGRRDVAKMVKLYSSHERAVRILRPN